MAARFSRRDGGCARLLAPVVLAVVFGGVMTSVTSANLTFDVRNGAGGNAVALSGAPNQAVTLEFFTKITGANGDTSDDGIRSFYASFYSTNVNVAPYTLSAGNLSFTFGYDASKFHMDQAPPAVVSLDGDADADLGSASTALPANWMFISNGIHEVNFVMGQQQHIGTLVYTQTAFNGGHGITQIYATGRPENANAWKQDGLTMVDGEIDTAASQRVTLYVAAAARAGNDQTFFTPPSTVTLDGRASVGSMNQWLWQIQNASGDWVTLTTGENPTLAWESLGLDAEGDVAHLRLITTYEGLTLDGSLNGNNTSMDEMSVAFAPEPGTMGLLAVSGMGLAWFRRHRKAAK
jgi:hypothetical protein